MTPKPVSAASGSSTNSGEAARKPRGSSRWSTKSATANAKVPSQQTQHDRDTPTLPSSPSKPTVGADGRNEFGREMTEAEAEMAKVMARRRAAEALEEADAEAAAKRQRAHDEHEEQLRREAQRKIEELEAWEQECSNWPLSVPGRKSWMLRQEGDALESALARLSSWRCSGSCRGRSGGRQHVWHFARRWKRGRRERSGKDARQARILCVGHCQREEGAN